MEYLGKFIGGGSGGSGGHGGGGGFGFNPLAQFDRTGDGKITEEDFVEAARQYGLGSLGEMAIRGAFKSVDKNHNGVLDLNEALGAFQYLQGILGQSGGSGHGGSGGGFGGMF